VQYVEVRLFDLNPLIDIGIAPEQSKFADAFLMMCLLRDSPPITSREQSENAENKRRVVTRGRDPELKLLVHNTEQAMRPMAHELFDDMQPFAKILDTAYGGDRYASTLADLRSRIDAPDTTPSAQVLAGIQKHGSLVEYTLHLSKQHHQSLLAQALDETLSAKFSAAAVDSLNEQKALEAKPQIKFEDYVAQYYA
jgi:glutamate--cysteine ligase